MKSVFRITAAALAVGFCFGATGCGYFFGEEKRAKEEVPENSTWVFAKLMECRSTDDLNEKLVRQESVYASIIVQKYVHNPNSSNPLCDYIECKDGEVIFYNYSKAPEGSAQEYVLEGKTIGTYNGKDITITGGAFSDAVEACVSEGYLYISDIMSLSYGNLEYELAFQGKQQ